MRLFDTFAGIGSFSLAAHWAGVETIAFSEVELYCCRLLEKRFPGIPNLGDIKGVTDATFRERGIAFPDIISGGIPCQPASLAGKRQGEADDRWLWGEFLRLVFQLRPMWVLAENPPGIISLKGKNLDWIIGELEEASYEVQAYRVSAANIGAPHLRERVWIVANSLQPGLASDARPCGEDSQRQQNGWAVAVGASDSATAYTEEAGRAGHTPVGGGSGRAVPRRSDFASPDASQQQDRGICVTGVQPDVRAGSNVSDVAHSDDKRQLQQERVIPYVGRRIGDSNIGEGRDWTESWYEVAKRICSVDDGLPSWLGRSERNAIWKAVKHYGREETERRTGLDLSKVDVWRTEQLKAYGNTCLPQIAYMFLDFFARCENGETL